MAACQGIEGAKIQCKDESLLWKCATANHVAGRSAHHVCRGFCADEGQAVLSAATSAGCCKSAHLLKALDDGVHQLHDERSALVVLEPNLPHAK